jgi:hypothetical protein
VNRAVSSDEHGIGPLALDCSERRIDLATGAGAHDLDLQPHRARGRFDVFQRDLGRNLGRVEEHRNPSGCRHQRPQEFQPLCR